MTMTRKIMIGVGLWMLLLVGGYMLFGGGGDENQPGTDPRAQATTSSATTPEQPQGTTPEESTPTTPDATTTPEVRSYSAEELSQLRTSDPGLYDRLTIDPQDSNPVEQQRQQDDLGSHPTYQKLPYDKGSVHIDVTGGGTEQRVEVEVEYSGSKSEAQQVWRDLLRTNNDRAEAYAVIYRKKGSS